MTRKTQIQFAATVVVLGALAWAVWPGPDEGAVSVSYAGVSQNDSNQASFAITNRSKALVDYFIGVQETVSGTRQLNFGLVEGKRRTILGRSAKTFDMTVFPTNQWRIRIVYSGTLTSTLLDRARLKLASYALKRGWQRIVEWIHPRDEPKVVYGPKMLGNKPAPPSSVGAKSL